SGWTQEFQRIAAQRVLKQQDFFILLRISQHEPHPVALHQASRASEDPLTIVPEITNLQILCRDSRPIEQPQREARLARLGPQSGEVPPVILDALAILS